VDGIFAKRIFHFYGSSWINLQLQSTKLTKAFPKWWVDMLVNLPVALTGLKMLFCVIKFYLQSVLVHSANCVKV
jgi:hypothetical protein